MYAYIIFLSIYSGGNLGEFYILVIMKNSAINMDVQMSLENPHSVILGI
jgi:hypothetical protein